MARAKTNNEVLLIMSEKIDKISEEQFQLSCDFSAHVNKTDSKFKEVLSLLESNDKTKQKGAIEQVSVNTTDISSIKTDLKVSKKVLLIASSFAAFISTYLFKIFWK